MRPEPIRPPALTTLAALDLAGAAATVAAVVGATLSAPLRDARTSALLFVAAGAGVALALLGITAGIGVLRLRPYGRVAQIVAAVLALPLFPFGTLAGGLVLAYLLRPAARALFSGRGDARTRAALREAEGFLVAGAIVGGATMAVAAMAAGAALAVPAARARRNAARADAALAELRTVVTAQTAYAAANEGRYDRLECLADPGSCLPPGTRAQPFLDATLLKGGERDGYVFRFHPGPPPVWDADEADPSPSSMTAFAYVATPAPGTVDARWFCADGTGLVCAGTTPPANAPWNGRCPSGCEALP